MLLSDIVSLLGCTELLGLDGAGDREIAGCFAADLMSEVLAFCGHGPLLVTGLTNVQSVHTADVVDAKAILYVNGKCPEAQVLALASSRGLPLLSTTMTMYEACGRLNQGGLPASTKVQRDSVP
jgi:predicted transcriptional regulator